jgi:hypothetical protein
MLRLQVVSLVVIVLSAAWLLDAAGSRGQAGGWNLSPEALAQYGASPFEDCGSPTQTCEQLAGCGPCPIQGDDSPCCSCAESTCAKCSCHSAWHIWCSQGATQVCVCGEKRTGICRGGVLCPFTGTSGTCGGFQQTCCTN